MLAKDLQDEFGITPDFMENINVKVRDGIKKVSQEYRDCDAVAFPFEEIDIDAILLIQDLIRQGKTVYVYGEGIKIQDAASVLTSS